MDTLKNVFLILDFLAPLFAFIYGVKISFKKHGILFLQILTCGFGCFMLGDMYSIFYLLCMGRLPQNFYIGDLGYIGGILFLFSSYYGVIDRLGDSGDKQFRKYRVISLLAPTIVLLSLSLVFFSDFSIDKKISCVLLAAALSPTSYFALKHLILPDVDRGILRVMRNFNILILTFCLLEVLYFTLTMFNFITLGRALGIFIDVIIVSAMPIAHRGVKKWFM